MSEPDRKEPSDPEKRFTFIKAVLKLKMYLDVKS